MSGFPGGIANGPSQSEHMEKDARVWERPWTLEEMRQSSASWSLAADSGLFLFLQDFSHKMLSKTHEIEKQLDGLIRDTKATDSCLHSVFSDFLMLSNTQFIENRVCDEEVEEPLPKTDAVEKQPERTREQKEAELIPKMQEAVNYGLRVLESAFEHLDIKAGNSDSEDEEVTGRVEAILEPKDLYVDRPLPYLIGSQAFMEQDDVGLGDLSSDEMSVDSDRDSVIESDDGKEATHSDEDFIQEGQVHNIFKKKSSMLSFEDDDEEEEDEDSDIFGESDKDDDDHDPKNSGPISFADELAARIRGEPVHKQEGDRASLSSKKKSKGRKEAKPSKTQAEDDSDDMFKPPKMDEIDDDDDDDDFSPFGGSSRLFSGGKGLFDDDNDERDLFDDAPKPFVPEEKKPVKESVKVTATTAEPRKSAKKIPTGGVSIFPANSLFSPGNDSDSVRSKENGTPNSKVSAPPKVEKKTAVGGGGLFDEEDEDDDFFGGKSLQKSESVVKEKPKSKTTVDLFDEDDEDDGNIFGDKFKSTTPVQVKKEVVAEPVKPPEKKMPAGAISMFGPGTKSLLSEGLKKRRQSTSEESEKSEENGASPDVRKAAPKPSPKPQTRGLFSDDEDAQAFPTIPRSQSKPEPTNQSNTNKAPVFLFDDDEEEDLFASAVKSKPKVSSSKTSPMQTSSAVSSSLFSDDEDQWLGATKTSETNSGGMKASASAPSGLTSTKTTPSSSLFEEEDDNELFAQTKESSTQKNPQPVALLFEDNGGDDEDDEDQGTLFNVNTNTALPTTKTLASASKSSSSQMPKSDTVEHVPTENQSLQQEKLTPHTSKSPEMPVGESGESKKKPAGAVSLFGGINVLEKQTKTLIQDEEEEEDDDFPLKPSPPPFVMEEKEEKSRSGAFGLFEDEDDDEWNDSIFTPGKPTSKTTPKEEEEEEEEEEEAEEKEEVEPAQTKSTGVLQDEELFSHSHEKDNDLDAGLFATSGRAESPPKAAAHNLFAEDDEDDLFSSPKPKVLPKIAEKPSKPADKAPLASPEPVSETEASLKINPAAMLPGAVPTLPGAISVFPGMDPSSSSGVSSSSLSPSPVTTPVGAQTDSEGVTFDTPVQVTTLQSVQKSRTKGAGQRRPQTRAARQKAVQRSVDDRDNFTSTAASGPNPNLSDSESRLPEGASQTSSSSTISTSSTPTVLAASPPSQHTVLKGSPRPSVLSLPESNDALKKESSKPSGKVLAYSDVDDIFASDVLFEATSVTNTPPTVLSTMKTPPVGSGVLAAKKDKDKSTFQSIFDDDVDDLFQPAKPRSTAKKAKQSKFLEDDDDDEDIFGVSNSSTPSSTSSKEMKNGSSFSKQEIFQDEVTTVPKVQKKHKEKPLDFSLFDDDTDIFADLTDTFKPKQKLKTKPEAKSIFDDDMDDIFSSSKVKKVSKASNKSKKTIPAQDTTAATDSSNIFDDPLNALGGT